MGTGRTDEFRKDAVRIALSSKDQKTVRGTVFPEDGLSRRQVADDLGVGVSTLNKWVNAHRDTDVTDVAVITEHACHTGRPSHVREAHLTTHRIREGLSDAADRQPEVHLHSGDARLGVRNPFISAQFHC